MVKLLLPLLLALAPGLALCNPITSYIEIDTAPPGGSETSTSKCSATVVSDRTVLTATHCLHHEEVVQVRLNGWVFPVREAIDDGADHVLLVGDPGTFKRWAKRANKPVWMGQAVWYIGNPGPLKNLYRRGHVAGENVFNPGSILLDINGTFGDSGAGVFNEANELVGMVSYLQEWERPGTTIGKIRFMGMIPMRFTREDLVRAGCL